MNIKKLLTIIITSTLLLGCVTDITPEMLRPAKDAIEPKLVYLQLKVADTQKTTEANVEQLKIQTYFYTIFQRELEQNIMAAPEDDKSHGTIEMVVIWNKAKPTGGSFVLAFFGGLTMGTLNLLGMPISYTKCAQEFDIKIYNNEGRQIKKYTYSAQETYFSGFYYKNRTPEAMSAELMKLNIMEQFKADLRKDAEGINKILLGK